MQKDFYSILEIPPSASEQEIKKSFRKLSIKYHPDKNFEDERYVQKFIEVKEAYDVLKDPEKRRLFDIEYYAFYNSKDSEFIDEIQRKREQEKQRRKDEEETFYRDPYKHFYSKRERAQQESPQVKPKKTPWGDEINDFFEFFSLPQRIGKIIGGFSNIIIGDSPISWVNLIFKVIFSKETLAILSGWGIFFFLLRQHWYYNLNNENSSLIMFSVFSLFGLLTIILRVANRSDKVIFNRLNYFIGINGFAFFECKGSQKNITIKREINFADITDLVVMREKTRVYKQISYDFLWYDLNHKEIRHYAEGVYDEAYEDMIPYSFPYYGMNVEAEKAWTIYLLDKMEEVLERQGYLQFNIADFTNKMSFKPYIQLGVGYITFIQGNERVKYEYKNIKRIYTRGNELFIEKDNYSKSFFIFKSGNRNSIPLDYLSNKMFFIKAVEILLGYSIVE